ncbi:hypothetical protein MMC30_007447 [Trapelia coarctata]|nr:hypothetical protein [Trapelia coarctata]
MGYQVQSLHEQYGSIVRLAPNELSFIDPAACRDIYGYRPGHQPFPKNQVWVPTPPKHGGKAPSILNADNEDHARIRKAWAYDFSDKSLKDQEPLIRGHVDLLITKLHQQIEATTRSAVLDITKWYNYCVFDIVGDLAFGDSFGCLEENRYHLWMGMIIHHFKAAVMMSACRYYPWLYKLLMLSVPKSSVEKQMQYFLTVKGKVEQRLRLKKDRPDFLSHLTRSREGLTDAEVISTGGITIMAGSNSLTTSLAGITNYLLRYPKTLQMLTKEVRGAYGKETEMNLTNLGQLPYLSAVIDEGLRIVSPVPLGMPRVVPKGGDTVCGYYLPEDTCVSFMQWGASLSKSNFTDPRDFRPERWLEGAASPASPFTTDKRDASQPFSLGQRSCLGRKLAYFELQLILARMVFNFDMSLPDGPGSGLIWSDHKTYATWVKDPFHIRLNSTKKGK